MSVAPGSAFERIASPDGGIATLRNLSENPGAVPDTVITLINGLARQYRFFHWHLEFPGIFTVPDDGTVDPDTGWTGGFSCIVGNPPWERVKLRDKEFFGNNGRADIEGAATAAGLPGVLNESGRLVLIERLVREGLLTICS
jgi:Eco57I restriction-modification methylase